MRNWQRLALRLLLTGNLVLLMACAIIALLFLISTLLLALGWQHIPGNPMKRLPESVYNKLKADQKLILHLGVEVLIPAIKDINQQGKDQAAHQREINRRVLDLMDRVPDSEIADLLKTLQRQNDEGVVRIVDSIAGLYEDVIDSMFNGMVNATLAEKIEASNVRLSMID
jgi:hypothetical protein